MPVTAELLFKFKCPHHGVYEAQINQVHTGRGAINYGCSACHTSWNTSQTSASELLLRDAISAIGAFNIKPTPLMQLNKSNQSSSNFKNIDVYFIYGSTKVAIEYDGIVQHNQTTHQQAVNADIAKSKRCNDLGMRVVRVQQTGGNYYNFADCKDVSIVTIPGPLVKIPFGSVLKCVKDICEIIGYQVTAQDEQNIYAAFRARKAVTKQLGKNVRKQEEINKLKQNQSLLAKNNNNNKPGNSNSKDTPGTDEE